VGAGGRSPLGLVRAAETLNSISLALNLDDLGFGVNLVATGGKSAPPKFLKFRNFACQRTQISSLIRTVPSLRGALRNVINAGRDAVDAAGALTNGADAYGEVVSFRRPKAGVKSARRSAGDGVKQAWSPGRARSKP
jgi:hypothetical protein